MHTRHEDHLSIFSGTDAPINTQRTSFALEIAATFHLWDLKCVVLCLSAVAHNTQHKSATTLAHKPTRKRSDKNNLCFLDDIKHAPQLLELVERTRAHHAGTNEGADCQNGCFLCWLSTLAPVRSDSSSNKKTRSFVLGNLRTQLHSRQRTRRVGRM
jgi:hypothetical protein